MAEIYADVIVDITQASLNKSYQYLVPQELQEKVRSGVTVRIPFGGGSRVAEGYVLTLGDRPKIDPERIKPILEVLEDRTDIESRLLNLALWMHRTYGSSLNNALKTVLPVRVKERQQMSTVFCLAVPEEKGRELLELYRKRNYKAKIRFMEMLLEKKELSSVYVHKNLKMTGESLKRMIKEGIVRERSEAYWRNPWEETPVERTGLPVLSSEQETVYQGILREWTEANRPCLIHGVTGSGKTQVYMRLMEEVLRQGKQVILLIPEIALSWQNVSRFRSCFGDNVTILNSKMSKGERSDQFERLKRGEAGIVIGPRSALFTPFTNLGLIIVDEEQENSYRSENAPRYDAREAAIYRAEMENAHVVFGSATPSLDLYYRCEQGECVRFVLKERYGGAVMPKVRITDMREELKNGNRSILGRELQEELAARLERKEQSILFLNRRGYSGFISCRSCGEVIKCPHCDVSLTYHSNGRMVCHYCGYQTAEATKCPTCGSPYISGFRAGTEKVTAEIKRIFPEARVLRMDADTTRNKDGYEKILKAFSSGEADILVGTQMIVKGHDFPGVTLVGVLAADLSLFVSDYRAAERTFQLLVQAVGRAGRGDLSGEAVIQTYHPDHYCIQAAAVQDYEAFYEEEITAREMLDYPPASNLLAIRGSGPDEQKLVFAMEQLKLYLVRCGTDSTRIMGPAPDVISKLKDNYQEVLYIKETDGRRIRQMRQRAEKFIEINSGFRQMYFSYDLNI
ncbi:MAG: primosomal protein N' [Eubacteriales bacterium]|nr:primosomal protein N' [Eubacteriales bacterium]